MPDEKKDPIDPAASTPTDDGAPRPSMEEVTEEECVFCRIARQELPADIVFHDQDILAFSSIEPKAPVHILIVPRQHIVSIAHLEKGDQFLVGNMVWVAKYLAESHRIADSGYKLIFNVGSDGGQTIPHLHLHLLGGGAMPE